MSSAPDSAPAWEPRKKAPGGKLTEERRTEMGTPWAGGCRCRDVPHWLSLWLLRTFRSWRDAETADFSSARLNTQRRGTDTGTRVGWTERGIRALALACLTVLKASKHGRLVLCHRWG